MKLKYGNTFWICKIIIQLKTILEHLTYKIILYDFAHEGKEGFLITKTLHKYPYL